MYRHARDIDFSLTVGINVNVLLLHLFIQCA